MRKAVRSNYATNYRSGGSNRKNKPQPRSRASSIDNCSAWQQSATFFDRTQPRWSASVDLPDSFLDVSIEEETFVGNETNCRHIGMEQSSDVTVELTAEQADLALNSLSVSTAEEVKNVIATARISSHSCFHGSSEEANLLIKPDPALVSAATMETSEHSSQRTIDVRPSRASSADCAATGVSVAPGDPEQQEPDTATQASSIDDCVVEQQHAIVEEHEAALLQETHTSFSDDDDDAASEELSSSCLDCALVASSAHNAAANLTVHRVICSDQERGNYNNSATNVIHDAAEDALVIDLLVATASADAETNAVAGYTFEFGATHSPAINDVAEHVDHRHNIPAFQGSYRTDTLLSRIQGNELAFNNPHRKRKCFSAPPSLILQQPKQCMPGRTLALRSFSEENVVNHWRDFCDQTHTIADYDSDQQGNEEPSDIMPAATPLCDSNTVIKSEWIDDGDLQQDSALVKTPLPAIKHEDEECSGSPVMAESKVLASVATHSIPFSNASPHSSLGVPPVLTSYTNVEVSVVESPLVFGRDTVDGVENERLIERRFLTDVTMRPNGSLMLPAAAFTAPSAASLKQLQSGRRSAPPQMPTTPQTPLTLTANPTSFGLLPSALLPSALELDTSFGPMNANVINMKAISPLSPTNGQKPTPLADEIVITKQIVPNSSTKHVVTVVEQQPHLSAFHCAVPGKMAAVTPTSPEPALISQATQGKRRDSFSGQAQPPLKKRYQFESASELHESSGDSTCSAYEVSPSTAYAQISPPASRSKPPAAMLMTNSTAAAVLPVAPNLDEGFRVVKPTADTLSSHARSVDKRGGLPQLPERRASYGSTMFGATQGPPMVQMHLNGITPVSQLAGSNDDPSSKLLPTSLMSGFIPYGSVDQGIAGLPTAAAQPAVAAAAAAALSQQYQMIQEIRSLPQGECFHLALSGWEWYHLDNVRLPCVFRNGEKYMAVHMVQMRLLAKFPPQVPGDLMRKHRMLSHKMSVLEAWIFNTVNAVHCKYDYGYQLFSPSDEVVKAPDVERFYWAVKTFNLNRMLEIYRNEIRANADLHLVLTAHISNLKSQAETELRYYLGLDRVTGTLTGTIASVSAPTALTYSTPSMMGTATGSGSRRQATAAVSSHVRGQTGLSSRRPVDSMSPPSQLAAASAERARALSYGNSMTHMHQTLQQNPILFQPTAVNSIHHPAAMVAHNSAFSPAAVAAMSNHVRLPHYSLMNHHGSGRHGGRL